MTSKPTQALKPLLAVITLTLVLTTSFVPVVAADSGTILRPDPQSIGIKPDAEGTISIRVEGVQDLYGVEFHLAFDPDVVEVVDADTSKPGVQIQPGDWLQDIFIAVNAADNATGKIDYAVTLLNPAPPVSGSGIVGTITFKAKSDGVSSLKMDKAILATRDAKEIEFEWQEGVVGVSVTGLAPKAGEPANGSTILPANNTILIVAAGFGVFAFVIALGVVIGAVWVRRRQAVRGLDAAGPKAEPAEAKANAQKAESKKKV